MWLRVVLVAKSVSRTTPLFRPRRDASPLRGWAKELPSSSEEGRGVPIHLCTCKLIVWKGNVSERCSLFNVRVNESME